MSAKKLIVLSLDALTPAALGCYGSSWNATPTIDAIAAGACLWDRAIASNADPNANLQKWFGDSQWMDAWQSHGSVELLSDSASAIALAAKSKFDQLFRIDALGDELPVQPAAEIEATQFAQLIASAAERIGEDDDWSLLWLHSDFLTHCWDAPRWLVESGPVEDFDDEPLDEAESLEAEMYEAGQEPSDVLDELPETFSTVAPPCEAIAEDAHPDLIATWMRTYGCQVRLIDELVNVLRIALEGRDASIVLVGTSGFCLGQNGWVGHQAGRLRTCHVHLPLIVQGCGPLRVPQVCSEAELPRILSALAVEGTSPVSPEQWSQLVDESVVSQMGSSARSVTTLDWFCVDQGDEEYRLFFKPDDINDHNDVSRLRTDVLAELAERLGPA